MSLDVGIVYQLWNDRVGSDDLFDRAAGEIGLDHITIPAVTGPFEQVRFAGGGDWRLFQCEGGWHYHANAKHYGNTRLRPRAARWLATRDVLGQMCERAAGRDVRVLFRVEPRGVAYLLEHHAQIRMKNAWGDETPASGACPSNPDMRELFRATLEELSGLGASGFQMSQWTLDRPIDAGRGRPWEWNKPARLLLDICFCESCRQVAIRADIDADLAARSVRVHFDRLASQPPADGADDAVAADQVLADYRTSRTEDLNAWLAQLAEHHARRRRFHFAELLAAGSACNGWSPLGRPDFSARAASALESDVSRYVRESPAPVALSLPVWRPRIAEAGDLVRLVSDAAAAGTEFFDFEGLHEAAPEALVWLHQAVRFARRGSPGGIPNRAGLE